MPSGLTAGHHAMDVGGKRAGVFGQLSIDANPGYRGSGVNRKSVPRVCPAAMTAPYSGS